MDRDTCDAAPTPRAHRINVDVSIDGAQEVIDALADRCAVLTARVAIVQRDAANTRADVISEYRRAEDLLGVLREARDRLKDAANQIDAIAVAARMEVGASPTDIAARVETLSQFQADTIRAAQEARLIASTHPRKQRRRR